MAALAAHFYKQTVSTKEALAAALEAASIERAQAREAIAQAGPLLITERVLLRDALEQAERTYNELVSLCKAFGTTNPAHPECDTCREYSIVGGPSHEPSRLCRMGSTQAHCSCAACW